MQSHQAEVSKLREAAAPVVLIVGATGLVGRHIVAELDTEPGGVHFRLAARRPEQVERFRAEGRDAEAERTCSARPVVGQWADGAGEPKLLLDGRFEFPDGVWVRRLPQKATANVAGPTAPRPVICTWLQCVSFGFEHTTTDTMKSKPGQDFPP